MIGLVSSLDILLAFAPDICDADMCPICSQLIKGPGASFCYLDLSMAPVDPWVSATSSVYSWLGWSLHAFTGPCLHLESIAPRGCLLCSAVSLPYQSCPMSWSCTVVSAPSAKRRLEWGPICPQSLELTGHSFFSLTISLILSPFLFPQVFYAKLLICWMDLFYQCPAFQPISGVKFYLKAKQ